MKLSCAFSIVVLFVTGLNIPLVASGTSSSTSSSTQAVNTAAANTTAASTSTTATATNTSTTTTTIQTTTQRTYVCIAHTCNVLGCLTNASNTGNCTGLFCSMVQRFNQTSYTITAICFTSCTEEDKSDGGFTVRTRCCQSDKCNKDDTQIVALRNGGSASNQTPLWILPIMLVISAFEILM